MWFLKDELQEGFAKDKTMEKADFEWTGQVNAEAVIQLKKTKITTQNIFRQTAP